MLARVSARVSVRVSARVSVRVSSRVSVRVSVRASSRVSVRASVRASALGAQFHDTLCPDLGKPTDKRVSLRADKFGRSTQSLKTVCRNGETKIGF